MSHAERLEELSNKRIIDLTAGELADIIVSKLQLKPDVQEKKYEYGIEGIMRIFHCSRSKAAKVRNDIDGAITQNGRTLIIDIERAIELFGKKKGGRRM